MKLFVGINVSSQDMKACVMNAEGESLTSLTVSNNVAGASYLKDQVIKIAQKSAMTAIQIGMEATSVYSWHPTMFS
jgi:activator of 2-hydroxyglutaryl-CoA dehydratase